MYGPQHRAGLDAAVVADEHRPFDHDIGRDVGVLAEPHPLPQLEAGELDLDPAVEDVLVGGAVRLERADVLPVPVDHVAVQLAALFEDRREHVAREVDDLALGDVVEHRGFEHVDAGVDRVGEHLAPRRLLEEALDRAVVLGDDDAELDRVLDPLQRDRRGRVLLAVGVDERARGRRR